MYGSTECSPRDTVLDTHDSKDGTRCYSSAEGGRGPKDMIYIVEDSLDYFVQRNLGGDGERGC